MKGGRNRRRQRSLYAKPKGNAIGWRLPTSPSPAVSLFSPGPQRGSNAFYFLVNIWDNGEMKPGATDNAVRREISRLSSNQRLILRETQGAATPLGRVAVRVGFCTNWDWSTSSL